MIDGLDDDVAPTRAAIERRDETVAAVRDHAGRIARELALLAGGDYGRQTFDTARGEWTLKYDGGDLQYLRFDPKPGAETYVVSTKRSPDPAALADAMDDYAAFVDSYTAYVDSLDGVLDDVPTAFPEVRSTASVVTERDRIADRVREVSNRIAAALHRVDGTDYGTFTARISGRRWELKRERDRVSYLRVGGKEGTYLVSQYGPPAAGELREHGADFTAFVEAFNASVADLDADLANISLGG